MKFKVFFIAAIMAVAMAIPASAQFRFGPRVGVNISELHFNKSAFDTDNRAGFTAGLMTEFTVPIIGVGFDASVMYVRRNTRWMEENQVAKAHRDYIDVPINLKWNIGLPLISHFVQPYLATGPAFSFLTSKKGFEGVKNKDVDMSWNFGLGVTLLKHLQIGGAYGLGITKATEFGGGVTGRNRYWTITAAYLF